MENNVLETLVVLQDALNEVITEDWKENRSELDFMIASLLETAELIDTPVKDGKNGSGLGWKWWKKGGVKTTDSIDWDSLAPEVFDNIKIELTDLLFFTLSQNRLDDYSGELDNIVLDDNDYLNIMRIITNSLLQKPNNSVKIILLLAKRLDFNIAGYYCAKHLLNYYRQAVGYGDDYAKILNGREDNEFLHEMIIDITIEDIELDAAKSYDKIAHKFYNVFDLPNEKRKFFKDWQELVTK